MMPLEDEQDEQYGRHILANLQAPSSASFTFAFVFTVSIPIDSPPPIARGCTVVGPSRTGWHGRAVPMTRGVGRVGVWQQQPAAAADGLTSAVCGGGARQALSSGCP